MLAKHSSTALIAARRFTASTATRGVATFTRSYPSLSRLPASRSRTAFFEHSFHPSSSSSIAPSSSAVQRSWASLIALTALAGLASIYGLASSEIRLEAAPPAASSLTSLVEDASSQVVVDPDTNLSFPLYIPTPASFAGEAAAAPRLRLVGLGVRTVSFLRVRVYVAALYLDESKLGAVPPSTRTLEEHVRSLLDQGTASVVRIVPVRNTDFNHLRDGFIRALQARLKLALKSSTVPTGSEAERHFTEAIQEVKESFPRGSVPKGSPLDLVVLPGAGGASRLNFEYDAKIFGGVQSKGAFGVGRELVLAYFADKGEISAPFKRSVEEGLLQKKQLGQA